MIIVREEIRKARRDHACEGYRQIEESIGWEELMVHHKEIKPDSVHKISKWEEYFCQTSVSDGSIGDWKTCKHCHEIIKRHKLWADE